MAEDRVIGGDSESKACGQRETVSRDMGQVDLDEVLEATQRLRFIARSLWEMKDFDDVELGTVSIMIAREADCIFNHTNRIEERLGA